MISIKFIHKVLLLVLLLLIAPLHGQDNEARLCWHNGDVLAGRLRDSESGQVRWSSPLFVEDLVVDTDAFASMFFRYL